MAIAEQNIENATSNPVVVGDSLDVYRNPTASDTLRTPRPMTEPAGNVLEVTPLQYPGAGTVTAQLAPELPSGGLAKERAPAPKTGTDLRMQNPSKTQAEKGITNTVTNAVSGTVSDMIRSKEAKEPVRNRTLPEIVRELRQKGMIKR